MIPKSKFKTGTRVKSLITDKSANIKKGDIFTIKNTDGKNTFDITESKDIILNIRDVELADKKKFNKEELIL